MDRQKYYSPAAGHERAQPRNTRIRNRIGNPQKISNSDVFDKADQTHVKTNNKFKSCILDKVTDVPLLPLGSVIPGNKSNLLSQTEPSIDHVKEIKKGLKGTLSYSIMFDEAHLSHSIIPFLRKYDLDDAKYYAPLTSECFIKTIGDYFYCALCCERERIDDRPIDNHLAQERHVNYFLRLRSELMNKMPSNESINMIALGYLTDKWLKENRLTDIQTEIRMMAVGDFCTALIKIDSTCYCRIVGSFYSGTSLIDSDVNIELIHPNSKLFLHDTNTKRSIHQKLVDSDADYGNQLNNHSLHYDLISNAVDTLYKFANHLVQGYVPNTIFTVTSSVDDLNRKMPRLTLLHTPTRVKLEITCYADSSHRMSCFLKNYITLDRRAFELSVLVKHWAKICKISNPKQGTLSPETFVILVIYFLQRVEPPILPCLHELVGKDRENQEKKETLVMDKFQNLDLNEHTNFEDERGTLGEDIEFDEETSEQEFDPEIIDNIKWKSKNTDLTHSLFVKFLKFFMSELANVKNVISIRKLERVPVGPKEWNTEFKGIENPVSPKNNMARSIGTRRTYDYIKNCFAHGYYYLTSLPMLPGLRRHLETFTQPTDYIKLFINLVQFDFYFGMKESVIKQGSRKGLIDEMIQQNLFARDVAVVKELVEYFIVHNRDLETIPATVAMNYDNQLLIPPDSCATIFCWLCRGIGHERSKCLRGQIPVLDPKQFNLRIDSQVNFDHQFLKLYVDDMIRKELSDEYSRVVSELTKSIREWTGLACELSLFGSTVNLLGSFDSDLDICMTLEGNKTGKGIDCVEILQQTFECLKHIDNIPIDSIEPILSARVPIIKFKYGKFDVDLSMYNQCAIHNSKLLRAYVLFDYRLAQLFYLVKRYARACCIADASRGSLSSYAWSLLVIHFLQHTKPPILPVLQELKGNEVKPVIAVNGWNVWFYEDISSITSPPNNTTLTTLFKQFLMYYANFNFTEYVVSIRTSRLLTKFQKNWTNCMIAIEDPFELTYNLSGRLDDPMSLYIRKSFVRTYTYVYKFQETIKRKSQVPSIEEIRSLFRGQAIMGSEPPYRGCRVCHRVGHRFKDCPERRDPNAVYWDRMRKQ